MTTEMRIKIIKKIIKNIRTQIFIFILINHNKKRKNKYYVKTNKKDFKGKFLNIFVLNYILKVAYIKIYLILN